MVLTSSTLWSELAWMKGKTDNIVLCSFLSFHCPTHHHLVKWSPVDTACRIAITHHAFSRSAKQWWQLKTAYLISIKRVWCERQHFGLRGCVNVVQYVPCHGKFNFTWDFFFFIIIEKNKISQKNILQCLSELAVHTLAHTVFKCNHVWHNFWWIFLNWLLGKITFQK